MTMTSSSASAGIAPPPTSGDRLAQAGIAAAESPVPPSRPTSHRPDLGHMLFATSKPGTEIKKQISYIAPGQTAKALMLIYLTFSVPIVVLAVVVGLIVKSGELRVGAIFGALLLNAVVGFVLMWIACHVYNWVASRFGGIEIVLSDTPEEL